MRSLFFSLLLSASTLLTYMADEKQVLADVQIPRTWVDQVALFELIAPSPTMVVRLAGHSWQGTARNKCEMSRHDRAVYYAVKLDIVSQDTRLCNVLEMLMHRAPEPAKVVASEFSNVEIEFIFALHFWLLVLRQPRPTVAEMLGSPPKSHDHGRWLRSILHGTTQPKRLVPATHQLKKSQSVVMIREDHDVAVRLNDICSNPVTRAQRKFYNAAHSAVRSGWGLDDIERAVLRAVARLASSNDLTVVQLGSEMLTVTQHAAMKHQLLVTKKRPVASVFFDPPEVLEALTTTFNFDVQQLPSLAPHMAVERPQHLTGFIREALLRGIPLSELRNRARRWHSETEDTIVACLHRPGPVSELQSLMCTVFVEAMTFNRPGRLPAVHNAVVALAKAALVCAKDAVVCPHPVCKQFHAGRSQGFVEWRDHFPEHYGLRGGSPREFECCWAAFWLSTVLGQEKTLRGDKEPHQPFKSANGEAVKGLFHCLSSDLEPFCGSIVDTRTLEQLCGDNKQRGNEQQDGTDTKRIADACRELHCLWLELQ